MSAGEVEQRIRGSCGSVGGLQYVTLAIVELSCAAMCALSSSESGVQDSTAVSWRETGSQRHRSNCWCSWCSCHGVAGNAKLSAVCKQEGLVLVDLFWCNPPVKDAARISWCRKARKGNEFGK